MTVEILHAWFIFKLTENNIGSDFSVFYLNTIKAPIAKVNMISSFKKKKQFLFEKRVFLQDIKITLLF